MKKLLITILLLGAAISAIAAIYVHEGLFNIAADVPHSAIVSSLMEITRDRSIAVRAKDIPVPPLDDLALVAKGARDYSEMCTRCHLAPGDKESELRQGLYPQPPDLTLRGDMSASEMFWVIKHGIKMSAMPAWGATHDDQRIWNMVAFLRKLPDLTTAQYQALVRASAGTHRHDHSDGAVETEAEPEPQGHSHHNGDAKKHQ
ncbi:MAG: cytochrome c [Betaproteobacteria bacterium]